MPRERSFNWRMVSAVCAVVVILGCVLTFFVRWNLNQTDDTAAVGKAVEHIETSYGEHVKYSTDCFQKIDRTLTAQHTLITTTREAMIAVSTTQKAIKEENGRLARSIEKLAEEVRRANGNP